MDAANILKPMLARGELQTVGATTLEEYRKYIEKDSALERRFTPVQVDEPSVEDTVEILRGLRDKYEAHHGVKITPKAIKAAVTLSMRYLPDRYLPDKAIDLMDEAAAMVNLAGQTAPKELRELEQELENVLKEKDAAASAQNFEEAAKWRDREHTLREEFEQRKQAWQKDNSQAAGEVDTEQIAQVLSNWSGIPVAQLQKTEMEQLLQLESLLHKRVIGQDEAVVEVAKAVRRFERPQTADWFFHLYGADGRGQNRAFQSFGQRSVWQRRRDDSFGYERIYGEAHRGPVDWRAARLCGARRGRPADGGGAPPRQLRNNYDLQFGLQRDKEQFSGLYHRQPEQSQGGIGI